MDKQDGPDVTLQVRSAGDYPEHVQIAHVNALYLDYNVSLKWQLFDGRWAHDGEKAGAKTCQAYELWGAYAYLPIFTVPRMRGVPASQRAASRSQQLRWISLGITSASASIAMLHTRCQLVLPGPAGSCSKGLHPARPLALCCSSSPSNLRGNQALYHS